MPLTLACYQGDVAAISELLQKGASVDQQDEDGYTPLFVASSKKDTPTPRACCSMRAPRLRSGARVIGRRLGLLVPLGTSGRGDDIGGARC